MADTVVLAVYCTAASRRVSVHGFFYNRKTRKVGRKKRLN